MDLNDEHRIARINFEAGGNWQAVPYKHWAHQRVGDVYASLGAEIRPLELPRLSPHGCTDAFPTLCHSMYMPNPPPPRHFDARRKWHTCPSIRVAPNQGPCGSCWAVAATSVLTDRFCIASQQANRSATFQNLSLATQYMLDCDDDGGGCAGGQLHNAWEFLQREGLPEEACHPYAHCPKPNRPRCGLRENIDGLPTEVASFDCPSNCAGGQPLQTFKAMEIYAVSAPGDVEAIQREVLNRGPVEVAFFVFSDFHSYRRGTYFRTPSAFGPLGAHAVRLIGWGINKHKVKNWLVANSFGRSWGMKGFFRIRRGTNECGIETTPAAGLPLLSLNMQRVFAH